MSVHRPALAGTRSSATSIGDLEMNLRSNARRVAACFKGRLDVADPDEPGVLVHDGVSLLRQEEQGGVRRPPEEDQVVAHHRVIGEQRPQPAPRRRGVKDKVGEVDVGSPVGPAFLVDEDVALERSLLVAHAERVVLFISGCFHALPDVRAAVERPVIAGRELGVAVAELCGLVVERLHSLAGGRAGVDLRHRDRVLEAMAGVLKAHGPVERVGRRKEPDQRPTLGVCGLDTGLHHALGEPAPAVFRRHRDPGDPEHLDGAPAEILSHRYPHEGGGGALRVEECAEVGFPRDLHPALDPLAVARERVLKHADDGVAITRRIMLNKLDVDGGKGVFHRRRVGVGAPTRPRRRNHDCEVRKKAM
jgi:hypothetical protein